jgi:hypothetical protein
LAAQRPFRLCAALAQQGITNPKGRMVVLGLGSW